MVGGGGGCYTIQQFGFYNYLLKSFSGSSSSRVNDVVIPCSHQ